MKMGRFTDKQQAENAAAAKPALALSGTLLRQRRSSATTLFDIASQPRKLLENEIHLILLFKRSVVKVLTIIITFLLAINTMANDSLCDALSKKDINKMSEREYDYFKFCKKNEVLGNGNVNSNSAIESQIDFMRAKEIAFEAVMVIAAYENAFLACHYEKGKLCKIDELLFDLPKSEWFEFYDEFPGKFIGSLKKDVFKFKKGTKWMAIYNESDDTFTHQISDVGAVLLTPSFIQ